ncbi:MAG: hypothetical protein RIT28_1208 [Pseudomonadota bacterium]
MSAFPAPLIDALLRTAARLETGVSYQWGHQGACNCGHLAQTITQLSPAQIHAAAVRRAVEDWAEQAREYCPGSGLPMDYILSRIMALGVTAQDIAQLERLSDPRVLQRLGRNDLRHNQRDDAIAYMRAWAALLAEDAAPRRALPERGA